MALDSSIWKLPPKSVTNSLDNKIPQVLGTSITTTMIKKDISRKASRLTLRSFIRPHIVIGFDSSFHMLW
jgi:hypothetical protein